MKSRKIHLKCILLFTLILISRKVISQENPYELNDEFYNEVKAYNIKEISFWFCFDSVYSNKEKLRILRFNKHHQITKNINVDYNKIVPREKYTYPSEKRIKMKLNADGLYWILFDYTLSDNGLIQNVDISGGNCYKIKIKYDYNDTLLIKKEIIDKSCVQYLIGVGTTLYEYNQVGKLLRTTNEKSDKYEVYSYDTNGFLNQCIVQGKNPDWAKRTIKYVYKNGKLVTKIEESYNSGNKELLYKSETIYVYDEKGLPKLTMYHTINENRWVYTYFTYKFY